jgi:hypothetical protein
MDWLMRLIPVLISRYQLWGDESPISGYGIRGSKVLSDIEFIYMTHRWLPLVISVIWIYSSSPFQMTSSIQAADF